MKRPHRITLAVVCGLLIVGSIFYVTQRTATGGYEKLFYNQAKDGYFNVISGSATITNKNNQTQTLTPGNRGKLRTGDTIRTAEESRGTIFWPDGSITRLGPNTTIRVQNIDISPNLDSIKVRFGIDSGKSWSRVVRYMGTDSYFQEGLHNDNIVASVRGTAFEVNTEKDYVYVMDHTVSLENKLNASTDKVTEGKAVSSSDPNKQVTLDVTDQNWIAWNVREDAKYLESLFTSFKEQVATIDTLTGVTALVANMFTQSGSTISLQQQIITASIAGDYDTVHTLGKQLVASSKDKGSSHEFLKQVYQNINYVSEMPGSSDTSEDTSTLLRARLRTLLVQSATEQEKSSLQDTFGEQTLLELMRNQNGLNLAQAQKILSLETIDTLFGSVNNFQNKLVNYYSLSPSDKTLIQNNLKQLGEKAGETWESIRENIQQ